VNPELVELGPVDDKADELADLVRRFGEETGSEVAQRLLGDWPAALERFTLVMPRDFKRVLDVRAEAEAEGLDEDQANARIMEVLHG
jgi:glutamate synthase (NADPH/NADH) large chain